MVLRVAFVGGHYYILLTETQRLIYLFLYTKHNDHSLTCTSAKVLEIMHHRRLFIKPSPKQRLNLYFLYKALNISTRHWNAFTSTLQPPLNSQSGLDIPSQNSRLFYLSLFTKRVHLNTIIQMIVVYTTRNRRPILYLKSQVSLYSWFLRKLFQPGRLPPWTLL